MSDQARAHIQGSYGTELEQSHKTSELYSELPKKPPVQGKQRHVCASLEQSTVFN
jgi:hypothetical protein